MSAAHDVGARHRVMLVHFDSYSAALSFVRWGTALLAPAGLPESATPMPPPAVDGVAALAAEPAADVTAAAVQQLGLGGQPLKAVDGFQAWFQTDDGPVQVHLLRFDSLDAPKAAVEASGGVFQPISALRGSPRLELGLAREVFNLIIGAGGGRA